MSARNIQTATCISAALSVACFGQVGHALAETYPPPPAWHPDIEQREHLRRSITLMDQSTPQKRNTVKIVFYGQSITSAESQHWWKEVSRYLHTTYPNAKLVIENRAISGHGSERLVKTAEADIYPFQPDLIIFHVYGSHIEYENLFRRIRQRTCADIIEQTDHITKDQALSEVADPTKLTPRQWDAWMNNSFLPSNAASYDACLADVHGLWKNYMKATGAKASDMLRDGIHLNARGDWLMAELIKLYLAPLPAKDGYDPHNAAGVSAMIPQTTPGQNSLRVQWTGTRAALVFRPEAKGQVAVLVDGRKPSAIASLYCFSRSSSLPGRDWPLLLRVGNQSPLVAEEWALTLQSITPDGKSGHFVVKGSVTGDDGEGDLASRFVSRSGRVVIEPDDWNIAYCVAGYRQPLPSGHTITWKAWLQGTDIATPSRQAPGVENAVTLAQNLAGGQHTLELQGEDLGQQIQCLRFYCPRDAVGPADTKVVIVDDFESYTNDQQLAKAWYKPPHGGGIRQTRGSTIKNSGQFSLKVEYTTRKSDDRFYSPICRVSKWNLAGCNALQFWFKPDGSGRALLVNLNIANAEGKNIHDLWDYTYVPKKGDTNPRIVTVPFSKLVKNARYADSPDTSPVFRPEALIEVALCIGGRNDEPGDGLYYFDDFQGVTTE